MEAELLSWVAGFSYPAVFALLVACGLGVPISEELVLITGGLVVARGDGNLAMMIAVGYAGTVVGDTLLYRIGRRVGPKALQNKQLRKVLTPRRVEWIEGHFDRHGAKTLFFVRFIPGLRAATFLIAGIGRFGTAKFLLADGLAALISAPLLVYLGWRFGMTVLNDVRVASRWVVVGVVVLGLGYAIYKIRRRNQRLARHEPEIAARMVEEQELPKIHRTPAPPPPGEQPPGY